MGAYSESTKGRALNTLGYVVEDDGFVTTYTVFVFYTTSSANTLFKVIVTVLCAQFLSGALVFF